MSGSTRLFATAAILLAGCLGGAHEQPSGGLDAAMPRVPTPQVPTPRVPTPHVPTPRLLTPRAPTPQDEFGTETPLELYLRYIHFVPDALELDEDTHIDTFAAALDAIVENGRAAFHNHHVKGHGYGNSFEGDEWGRNGPSVAEIANVLTHPESLSRRPKAGEKPTPIAVADIGCGIGLTAAAVFQKLAKTYGANGTTLRAPIAFDLIDRLPENSAATKALAGIVNRAFPQYFHVNATTSNITEGIASARTYQFAYSLNVFHFIDVAKWGVAFKHIAAKMDPASSLLMTVDLLDSSSYTAHRPVSPGGLPDRFVIPQITVWDTALGRNEGDAIADFDNIGLSSTAQLPGKDWSPSEIDFDRLRRIVRRRHDGSLHLRLGSFRTFEFEEFERAVRGGQLAISSGAYAFDASQFQRALKISDVVQWFKIEKPSDNWLAAASENRVHMVGVRLVRK